MEDSKPSDIAVNLLKESIQKKIISDSQIEKNLEKKLFELADSIGEARKSIRAAGIAD